MIRLRLVTFLAAMANKLLNHRRIRLAQRVWWLCRVVRDWGTNPTPPRLRQPACLECGHVPCDQGCYP